MQLRRITRAAEASIIALYFFQASRLAISHLLRLSTQDLIDNAIRPITVYTHLALLGVLLIPWVLPSRRQSLPNLLSVSALLAAVARTVMSVPSVMIEMIAAILVIAFSTMYFVSLLRANWRTWSVAVPVGLAIQQLLSAYDTYDFSLRPGFTIYVVDVLYRVPWIVVQTALLFAMGWIIYTTRRNAQFEEYNPAHMTAVGGLAAGGFLGLELIALSLPSVMSRWADVSVGGLIPWVMVATLLPLLPSVRLAIGEIIQAFDERLRGIVWFLIFLLCIIIGNRFSGTVAAGCLVITQFMAVMLLTWCFSQDYPSSLDHVGPSFSLCLITVFVSVYVYGLALEYWAGLSFLRDRAFIVVLSLAVLLSLPRLFWREHDPWLMPGALPRGIALIGIVPMVVLSFVLGSAPVQSLPSVSANTLRIATYNINGGFDSSSRFQLDQIGQTLEFTLADVILLQEVDNGRPISLGIDQAQYLARRLGMFHHFFATTEQVRGVAILSRWPTFEPQGTVIPAQRERLGAVRVVVQDPATLRTVTVVSVQFEEGPDDLRLQQLGLALGIMGEANPAVLAGDFAGSSQDVLYQQLMITNFIDPDSTLGIDQGFTYPAEGPLIRRDYVLLRGLIPLNVLQSSSRASDHRLVLVEAGWP